jgi:hypothetical protein
MIDTDRSVQDGSMKSQFAAPNLELSCACILKKRRDVKLSERHWDRYSESQSQLFRGTSTRTKGSGTRARARVYSREYGQMPTNLQVGLHTPEDLVLRSLMP